MIADLRCPKCQSDQISVDPAYGQPDLVYDLEDDEWQWEDLAATPKQGYCQDCCQSLPADSFIVWDDSE